MGLATDILGFFYIRNGNRSELGISPKSIGDFLQPLPNGDGGIAIEILRICILLESKNLMWSFGSGEGSPPFNKLYFAPFFDEKAANYGTYDFMAYGFPSIRRHFEKSVFALEVVKENGDKGIGSGFLLNKNWIFTCRHCIENMKEVIVHGLPIDASHVTRICVSSNPRLDIAMIEFEQDISKLMPGFELQRHEILDQVMTMGYPPIPGFESVLITETAQIAGHLQSSVGQIGGESSSYLDAQGYILITARVKGGNSGGPVINESGKVVGMITLLPGSEVLASDLLGYGAALPSTKLGEFFLACASNSDEIVNLDYKVSGRGFSTFKEK